MTASAAEADVAVIPAIAITEVDAALELEREDVEIHIENTLYSENDLGPLEEYVNKQMNENAPYDFFSNLYLMKMYSLYPSKAKLDTIMQLLLKSMMNLPNSDFTALVYLIPITMQSKYTEIETILNMGQALEDCEFDAFWTEFYDNQRIFTDFKQFKLQVQGYICLMISSVYQNLSVDLLYNLLQINSTLDEMTPEQIEEESKKNIEEKEEVDENDDDTEILALQQCLTALTLDWKISDGTVFLPKTDENSAEVKRKTQFVSTDQMNTILGSLF